MRITTINNQDKLIETPEFFITNNFGGGGTNVSRLFSYLKYLDDRKINILLNYYYLNRKLGNKMVFDKNLIDMTFDFKDIKEWVEHVREIYINNKLMDYTIFRYSNLNNLNFFMLDSGSGNILRNIIEKSEKDENLITKYEEIIDAYHSYANQLRFNIIIAMDFAKKYTYKAGETENNKYLAVSKEFNEDLERNLELLEITGNLIKNKSNSSLIYAPIHGNTPENYLKFLKNVIKLESKLNFQFDGFAIGGIADTKKKDKNLWKLPKKLNRFTKSAFISSRVTQEIRNYLNKNNDHRHIHILGAGNHFNIIPLWINGADSFDCHSSWRRSTENKILIPLLDEELEFLNNNKIFSFQKLESINDKDFICDCNICNEYSLQKIKNMTIRNKKSNIREKETYYLGEILVFLHSIFQYKYLLKKLKSLKNFDEIIVFIKSIPEKDLSENLLNVINDLENFKRDSSKVQKRII